MSASAELGRPSDARHYGADIDCAQLRRGYGKTMTDYAKALTFTVFVCLGFACVGGVVQVFGQSSIDPRASYLDPPIVDYLAFSGGLFLVAEGFYRIRQHRAARFVGHISRCLRCGLGSSILTIHIIQFLHK